MERSLNTATANTVAATGSSQGSTDWQAGLRWLVPLWRHAVWLVALFALLTLWVDIRVEVQQLRKDLDRSGRAFREARLHNDQLQLELDARSRSFALEAAAAELGLSGRAALVTVPSSGDAPASGGGRDE